MLSPGAVSPRDLGGRWWVAHTRARFEKSFAFDLLVRGVGFFLPMIARTLVSGGRKRQSMLPLFPSYVFLCGSREDRHAAVRTRRLAQVIDVVDQVRLVNELSALHRAIAGNASLALCPSVARGQRCRVTSGPFEGVEGVVVSTGGGTIRIVMEVSLLGQGAAMEVDGRLLEPVLEGTRAMLEGKGLPC